MSRRNSKRPQDLDPDSFEEDDDYGSGNERSGEGMKQLTRDLLGRWHWIALGLILGLVGGLYYLAKAPKEFSATSSLLVKQQASSVMPGAGKEPDDLDLRRADSVNTVAQRVTRFGLLLKVASLPNVQGLEDVVPPETNWFPDWSHQWLGVEEQEARNASSIKPTELANRIGSWTSVNVRRGTRLLDITITHPSPDVCKVIADAIAAQYVEELDGSQVEGQDRSSETLSDRSEEARKSLEKKQEAQANYQQVLAALKRLEDNEIEFRDLDRILKPLHPKHIVAKATLDDLQERFLAEFVDVRSAPVDLEYWNDHRSEWDKADLSPSASLQIAKRLLTARASVLVSEIESEESIFEAMLAQVMSLEVGKGTVEGGLELSSPSRLPGVPSSPKGSSVIMSASIAGLGAGLALAFLLSKLDTKIHTVMQVELLTNLPVLATIGDLQPKVLQKIIAEKGADVLAQSPGREKWDQRITFREGLTDTIYAETFRILRASVSLLGDEKSRKITLFSSALPGEGKTLTSTNFAIASAQQGKKTLLIDLDLRKPAVHKVFGHKRSELKTGVTELLAGKVSWQEALTTKTGQENLFCLFAGVKAPNPGELLNSKAVTELLESLVGDFDVIVIDSTPLLAVPDTRLLVPLVDNFCLVIRAEQTPKAAIRKAINLLEDDGTEPAGIVINGYEEKSGLFNKRYGYGYGYGQYGKGYGYGSYGAYGSDDID